MFTEITDRRGKSLAHNRTFNFSTAGFYNGRHPERERERERERGYSSSAIINIQHESLEIVITG